MAASGLLMGVASGTQAVVSSRREAVKQNRGVRPRHRRAWQSTKFGGIRLISDFG